MIIFVHRYGYIAYLKKMVHDMNELKTRLSKNRKHMEPILSMVPHVEVVMAKRPLRPVRTLFLDNVTLKQSFYYESDEDYFEYADEFFIPVETLPDHILAKILEFDDEVDITEEINHELFALDKDKM